MNLRLLALPFLAVLAIGPVRADEHPFKEPFSRSGPFRADGRVTLENVNGGIVIETWDRNEIRIEGEKSARTEEELKLIELTMEVSESRADIKVRLPKRRSGWFGNDSVRGGVKFKLTIPANAALERIKTVNSSVEIQGVRGPLDAETVNGRIRAHDLGGNARLRTVNGQLEASFVDVPAGRDLSFNTVNGSIRVTLPANAGFELRTSVVNGHVDCAFPLEMQGRIDRKRVSGKVGDGRAALAASSVNGSIRIEKR
jgi:DUF4097 and DUF4098 domain-containing protein YvlB